MKKEKAKLLIIGGGPAGYTAAIYAARAGISPILYEGPQPGGQLTTTTEIENYPGYPTGIQGVQMMEDFRKQALRFGAKLRYGTITSIERQYPPYCLSIDNSNKILTETIIIATGAAPRWLGLPSEERLRGKGVSSCAVCDGYFSKGQDVAVVGGGDNAAEEALYLAKLCKQVYLLVRRGIMRASHIMRERVSKTKNIQLLWHTEVKEILGKDEVEGIRIIHNKRKKETTLPLQGLFIAIGHIPNTKIFTNHLALDSQGYIKTIPGTTKTSIPGIFAAGDVQDTTYRQAITAAGTGCMAALEAERFLATIAKK